MALTRKLLEGMGIDEKQIETIIEAHMETVNGLKSDRDKYKELADQVPNLEKQIEEASKASETQDDWKKKYSDEHKAFEDYKTSTELEKTEAKKAQAYRAMLIDAGVDPRRVDRIMKITDLSDVVLNKEGTLDDLEKLTEDAKKEWADFILQTRKEGADTATPPDTAKGVEGADPAIKKMLQERHERLYGKVETTKED